MRKLQFNKFLTLGKLALRDLWFDKKVSFCVIASLIAVIAPLLLLFSLKYGVVSQLHHQLLKNPSTLEVKITTNSMLSKEWFTWLEQQPETQFSIPLTRSLSVSVDLRVANGSSTSRYSRNVDLIPTKLGDPLLEHAKIVRKNGVILSSLAAEELKVGKQDKISIIVTRNKNNQAQNEQLVFSVDDILPKESLSKRAVFVPLDVLLGIENYKDNIYTDIFPHIEGVQLAKERHFARARIYAKSLDDVEPLAIKLRKELIETSTEAKAISDVKAIDTVLNMIFIVIALTSIIGCVLSLFGAFLANIDRKRKDIALLRLLGFQQNAVGIYLVFQSMILSGLAFIFSLCFFMIGSQIFNHVLGKNLSQIFISSLSLGHLIIAFLLSLILASIVAGIGAIRAVKIQPAESLRDI
ncbi:ABC transporter permease [Ursidibacter sp. B-7004-1]